MAPKSQERACQTMSGETVSPQKAYELRQALKPSFWKLYRQAESLPFRQPVSPTLPNYFDIIKRPMDLSTIKKKMYTDQYVEPSQYVDDVWLMFGNAWRYNRETSLDYRYCTKLSEVFVAEIEPVMKSLGYCCGRKYKFQFQRCFGKQLCNIPRDAMYMCYQKKYTYCLKCFSDIAGEMVTVDDAFGLDPTSISTQTIPKNNFIEKNNYHLDVEPFIYCKDCGRKMHQICVLHINQICPEGFTCDACLQRDGRRRKGNIYNSKKLPNTKLGLYMDKLAIQDLVGCVAKENRVVASASGGVAAGSGENSNGCSPSTSSEESKRLSIQRCIQSLVHACQCRDANCRFLSCHEMKRVVKHTNSCKRKSNQTNQTATPGCTTCKQLMALCCFHAKHCQESKCPVLYCIDIKHNLRHQQLQQRLQQAMFLKRRIASMASMSEQSSQPQQTPQHEFSPSAQQSGSQQCHMKPATPPLHQQNQMNNHHGKGKHMPLYDLSKRRRMTLQQNDFEGGGEQKNQMKELTA